MNLSGLRKRILHVAAPNSASTIDDIGEIQHANVSNVPIRCSLKGYMEKSISFDFSSAHSEKRRRANFLLFGETPENPVLDATPGAGGNEIAIISREPTRFKKDDDLKYPFGALPSRGVTLLACHLN
jgi:hypothetical protein